MINDKLNNTGAPTKNAVQAKAYAFALLIIDYARELRLLHEYELSKQLLRSGTSIGANIEEAQLAQSKKDFISKIAIASKEANETRYWIRLIRDGVRKAPNTDALVQKIDELIRLLVAIRKTSSNNTSYIY